VKKALGIAVMGAIVVLMLQWGNGIGYNMAYQNGRQSMYDDMVRATGAVPGSILQVLQPADDPITFEGTVCTLCHQGRKEC
jgi:hypothetical protein